MAKLVVGDYWGYRYPDEEKTVSGMIDNNIMDNGEYHLDDLSDVYNDYDWYDYEEEFIDAWTGKDMYVVSKIHSKKKREMLHIVVVR